MWESLRKAETWSGAVIGAATEVHRIKRPGLIEGIYKKCFRRECELRQIPYVKELEAQLEYKGFVFEEPLRLDFLIDVTSTTLAGKKVIYTSSAGNDGNRAWMD